MANDATGIWTSPTQGAGYVDDGPTLIKTSLAQRLVSAGHVIY